MELTGGTQFLLRQIVVCFEIIFVGIPVHYFNGIGVAVYVIVTAFRNTRKKVSSCISGYINTPRVKQKSVFAIVVFIKHF